MENQQDVLHRATKCLESCIEYRKTRFDEIKRSEDMYLGKVKPALKGRFNIPLPILEGYVTTLLSKIDDQISIKFKKGRESTLKTAKKVTAAWEKDSAPDMGNYNGADLDGKSMAIFSGFSVLKLVPSAKPYKQELIALDHNDVIFEPFGGQNIKRHLFKGQLNIFKSKQDLKDGVEAGYYLKDGVEALINGQSDTETKKVSDDAQAKINRFLAMGLNPENYNYVGSDVYNLTEMIMDYGGEEYYLLFNYQKQIVIRFAPLLEVYPAGCPFTSWHTERNPINFLSRAPVDGVRPVAEAIRTLINQNFDNIQRRNWDMVLYNAKKIMNPSEFEFRPNGLIRVNLKDGESFSNAYEKMQTPDTSTITINLTQFLNSFIGEKTGVTPTSQGTPETDVLGIQNNIIQQTADRFGLINKFYVQAHVDIARQYKTNLAEFMPPKGFMVKYTGINGLQEEELTKKEAKEELDVQVVSANTEAQNDEKTKARQSNSLLMIIKDQGMRQQVGDKWLTEEILRNGGWTEDQIRAAMNKEEGATAELLSEAAQAIEQILDGEDPKLNNGANTQFIRKILNYAIEESDTIPEAIYLKLMKYANDHIPIAERNAQILMATIPQMGQPQTPMNPQTPPVEGTPMTPNETGTPANT